MELDTKVQFLKDIEKKKRNASEYVIDEALIKVDSKYFWLWIAIESKDKKILAQHFKREKCVCNKAIYC